MPHVGDPFGCDRLQCVECDRFFTGCELLMGLGPHRIQTHDCREGNGHRNPQGIAWDADGQLWSSEHGESGNDEINQITAGGNYGWPIVQGDEQQDGMLTPYIHSGNSAWGPSGIAFAGNELVAAALPAQILYVMDDNASSLQPRA